MNAFVFWPDVPEVSVVSLVIQDGVLIWGARDEDGRVLVSVPIRAWEREGIRAILAEQFGDEEAE